MVTCICELSPSDGNIPFSCQVIFYLLLFQFSLLALQTRIQPRFKTHRTISVRFMSGISFCTQKDWGVSGLTCVQDVWQDGNNTQLTVLTGLLHEVFIENLEPET